MYVKKYGKSLRAAFPFTIPVLTGFLFLGMAYGILMSAKGYGPVWSFLMSALCFCGSMQFVAITLLTSAFHPLGAFLMTLMVNARHLFYGISMLEKYKGTGKIKGLLIFWMCDETFSINCSAEPPEGIEKGEFYFWTSFLDYSYWVIGSVLGGVAGNILHFNTEGLDFVLTALFVVIFLEQCREKKNRIPAWIGAGCSVLALVIFGADQFIIPAMFAIVAALAVCRNRLGKEGQA